MAAAEVVGGDVVGVAWAFVLVAVDVLVDLVVGAEEEDEVLDVVLVDGRVTATGEGKVGDSDVALDAPADAGADAVADAGAEDIGGVDDAVFLFILDLRLVLPVLVLFPGLDLATLVVAPSPAPGTAPGTAPGAAPCPGTCPGTCPGPCSGIWPWLVPPSPSPGGGSGGAAVGPAAHRAKIMVAGLSIRPFSCLSVCLSSVSVSLSR